jgi:type IV pilus assembly protein PilM
MLTKTKAKSLVGLDIEAGSIAAAEVRVNGGVEVARHGVVELPPGTFREGEVADAAALAGAVKELFSREKLPRTVRVGVANQRVAVRSLRLPPIENPAELETAIRFQAQDHLPMPLDQAVLEWQIVHGPSRPADAAAEGAGAAPTMEVVAVAARREMVSGLTAALRAGGVRPVGIDVAAFGMIRALAAGEAPLLYCNLGDVTNLAVARGSACLFTRISPFGVEGIAQRLAERRGLTLEHARQWLTHVGLERELEAIEGDPEIVSAAREALGEGVAKLADELRVSLEYYGRQEGAVAVEGVVACGPGTTIPGLVGQLAQETGQRFEVGRPAPLQHLGERLAARLTLPYGLALEG